MAFKIDSISKMNSIATNFSNYASEAEGKTKEVMASLDSLSNIVSGQGVGDALNKLKTSLSTNTTVVVQTLNFVSQFISNQTAGYAQNEETTSSTLDSIQSALDNINS